jgi:hypothetical protein
VKSLRRRRLEMVLIVVLSVLVGWMAVGAANYRESSVQEAGNGG